MQLKPTETKIFAELDVLVAELSKKQPNESLIRRKMYQLGIGYCSDPVERLNRVLLALHPTYNMRANGRKRGDSRK